MKKFKMIKLFLIINIVLVISIQVFSELKEIIIFSKDRNIDIIFSKCGDEKAINLIRTDSTIGQINWKWENKSNIWCGWGTESIPDNDIT